MYLVLKACSTKCFRLYYTECSHAMRVVYIGFFPPSKLDVVFSIFPFFHLDNIFRLFPLVGCWLYRTNSRLCQEAHKYPCHSHTGEWRLEFGLNLLIGLARLTCLLYLYFFLFFFCYPFAAFSSCKVFSTLWLNSSTDT